MKEPLIRAQNCLQNDTVFALVRLPGGEKEFYQGYSNNPHNDKEQIILKGWGTKESAIYIGSSENLKIQNKPSYPQSTSKAQYQKAFEECMKTLQETSLKKVVLSRIKEVRSPGFSPISIFEKACLRYQDAFVYLVQHPTAGLWFGASPEILLKKKEDAYESVSLAGTQEYSGEKAYKWGEKEKVEQQFVTSQIKNILRESGAKIKLLDGPNTVRAGSVVHLKTVFNYSFDGFIQKLLDDLHPTAAVAGLPRKESIELISRTEKHKRGLYTGYIGTIDSMNADIYVNLRCMQMTTDRLLLYLGGGLTLDSNLDAEWNETELKAKSLLNLLNED